MIYILKCILFASVFQIQLIDPLPIPKKTEHQTPAPSTSFVLHKTESGGAVGFSEPKPTSTAANFYGPNVKPPTQHLDTKAPKPLDSGCAVSVKRPAVCVRGKCVPHSEERFRVEVGYNAELITVFKNIPSRNYGELWSSLLSEKSLNILMTLFSWYAIDIKKNRFNIILPGCDFLFSWLWLLIMNSLQNCNFPCRSYHKDVELQPQGL